MSTDTEQITHDDKRLAKGQATRARLIEEGLRLFALKGFDAVSTRELASAAGVNIATIHFHFKGKGGLYAAIIDEVIATLSGLYREVLAPLSGGPDPERDPAALVRETVAGLVRASITGRRSRWMSLLLQREFIAEDGSFPRIFTEALRPILEPLAELVRTATGRPAEDLRNKVHSFALFIVVSAFARNRASFLAWSGLPGYAAEDIEVIAAEIADLATRGLTGER